MASETVAAPVCEVRTVQTLVAGETRPVTGTFCLDRGVWRMQNTPTFAYVPPVVPARELSPAAYLYGQGHAGSRRPTIQGPPRTYYRPPKVSYHGYGRSSGAARVQRVSRVPRVSHYSGGRTPRVTARFSRRGAYVYYGG